MPINSFIWLIICTSKSNIGWNSLFLLLIAFIKNIKLTINQTTDNPYKFVQMWERLYIVLAGGRIAYRWSQTVDSPIIAAQNVVNMYKPIVFPTNFPALPKLNISKTEIAIETKTRGSTMHFNARMNRSPTRPIHRIAVALLAGSSGFQKLNPIPMPIPFDNIVEQYGKLYL